ncbi:Hypothetical protein GLP15_72 [Giardia lamblia P15]|uniref:Uncharacterized protein n=1 Tax=Giardia intestinalis (strain P15) TaxID=658858 RepID=E1F8F1_GIAIA|nr:Hypothetical protein GLP15_72 [Giardia lamblia P15]
MSYLSFLDDDAHSDAISHYDFLQLIDRMSEKEFQNFFVCILDVLLKVKYQRSHLLTDDSLVKRLHLLIASCKEERVILIAALMYYERMLAYKLFSEATYYTLGPIIASLALGCKMYGESMLHLGDACAVANTGVTTQNIIHCELALMDAMKNNLTLKSKKFYHFLYLAIKNANLNVSELSLGKVSLKLLDMAAFIDTADAKYCDVLPNDLPIAIRNIM